MKQAWHKTLGLSAGFTLFVIAVLAVNMIAAKFFVRLDLTEEKVFTLSQGTRKILAELPSDVQVKFYFTRSNKELPVPIKTYATRVEEVLREYASLSKGRLQLEVVDPKPDTDDEEWARKYGLRGARLPSGGEMVFGVVFLAGSKELPIPYLDPRREEFLEYDLSEALVRLSSEKKLKVALYSSLPVAGMGMPGMGGSEGWAFVEELKRNYDFKSLSEGFSKIEAGTDVVLVFHPKNLPAASLFALDQFVGGGGRLIAIVDPFSRYELGAVGQQAMMSGQMPEMSSDLPELFKAWGIEYNKAELIGDRKYMVQVNAGGAVVPYPFFMDLQGEAFNRESVVTSQLNQVLVAEGGGVALKAGSELHFEPLLQTSTTSGTAAAGMVAYMGPAETANQLRVDDKKHSVAAIFSGRFPSAYPDGPPEGVEAAAGQQNAEPRGEGMVMVVADGDMFSNDNAVDQICFGPQVIMRPRNDNLALLFNALEYLGGSDALIGIRSRGRIARPFTKVQELQAQAQERWQKEEEQLSAQINELQRRLQELQADRSTGSRLTLNQQQQAEIDRFRQQEVEARRRRREVRKNLREEIEQLGTTIIAANMVVLPAAVSLFGVGMYLRRSRRTRRKGA